MQTFDIIIVGGGMVGATLACSLQNTGLNVALLENRALLNQTKLDIAQTPALRVSAINEASKQWLSQLGIWERITHFRYAPYSHMEVWDKDSFAQIQFHAHECGHQYLGYIVENHLIQQESWASLQEKKAVSLLDNTHIERIVWGENEVFLNLQNGSMLSSKLIIAADGANSQLRQQAHIPLFFRDYGQHALVATIRSALPHQNYARQIFHYDGVLAFLPLWQQDLCSIVWSVEPLRAKQLELMDATEFNKILSTVFDMKLGICTVESDRQVIPLVARYARSFAAHRLALIGDAAHTIHPLAGQGVNLGFMDAIELSAELIRIHKEGKDIGQYLYLQRYERRRKLAAAKMLAAMQGFQTLFTGHHPVKKLVRDIGLVTANHLPELKPLLLRHAMGLD